METTMYLCATRMERAQRRERAKVVVYNLRGKSAARKKYMISCIYIYILMPYIFVCTLNGHSNIHLCLTL